MGTSLAARISACTGVVSAKWRVIKTSVSIPGQLILHVWVVRPFVQVSKQVREYA